MQRGTYRVHGCGRCKKRKIKCDNVLPCCSQCKRIKKPCPGSTAGLIFQYAGTWIPASGTVVAYDQRQETISRLAMEIGAFNASPWTPHHWFFTIPQLELRGEFQHVILIPLRAISIAFKALHSGDAALRPLALQHYAKGLAWQRRQLSSLCGDKLKASSEDVLEPLLMALLLLEFEMMAPLSKYSWIGHARGSAQLLALLSPEACQATPLFEMFWQLRFAMGYTSMLTQKSSCLDQPLWREIPFLSRGRTSLDDLTDPFSVNLQAEEAGITNTTTASQRMMRILRSARRLGSHARPVSSPGDVEEASGNILTDAEYLLTQDSTSFRMAMQCVFAIHLVARYAPCPSLSQKAETLYCFWHSRLTL